MACVTMSLEELHFQAIKKISPTSPDTLGKLIEFSGLPGLRHNMYMNYI